MAKSKLIKDLVSGDLSLVKAFDRLLVIAMEIEDSELIKWAKQEKNGYDENDILPEYRYVTLTPIGNYQLVSMGYIETHTRQPLPTLGFTDEMKEKISHWKVKDSIAKIIESKKTLDNGQLVGIIEPPEVFSLYEIGTNIKVTSATLALNALDLENILECTKTKLIEVLTLLEKNFGNLDEVDIDTRDYDSSEINALKTALSQIVHGEPLTNVYYISNSKIKNSNIGKNNKSEKTTKTEISPTVTIQTEGKEKKSFLKKLFHWGKK